ncbi:Predicted arabinose efflux permease, MFS family [Alicyclobacillus vulcanalis]|uniref:Predicted arabinose efflux permease, MFS family n=2 Tax=Alicyclobacillus vulcanalis TaxID=252246 RepID=A0A1N7PC91_9BACL|nr:Predicted arabinose efflux permease, MFS family [Alicyclobacillus vulcanalis]
MCVVYGLVFADRFGITNLFPQIARSLHLNDTQLGETMSAVALAWGFGAVVFAYVSDIIGNKKRMLIALVLVFSISTLFSGLATSFIGLLLARVLLGAAEGPTIPLVQSTVLMESSPHRKGRNTGLPIATSALFNAITPILLVCIATRWGWRYGLFVITIPGLIVALFLARFMKEPLRQDVPSGSAPGRVRWADVRVVLRSRNVWLSMCIAIFFVGGCIATLNTFMPLYLVKVGHVSQSTAALVVSFYGIMSILGNILLPSLSDKIDRKKAFLIASFLSTLSPVPFIAFANRVPLMLLAIFVLSLGQGIASMCMFVIPGESVPPRFIATAQALPNFVGEVVGGTIGSIVAGWLGDHFGLRVTMIVDIAIIGMTFVLGLGYKETALELNQASHELNTAQ